MTYSNSGNQKSSRRRPDTLTNIRDNSVDIKNRVIYAHAEFDTEESGIDFRMAIKFIQNLDYLNSISNKPIILKMFSHGGCWNYGMSMYDAISTSRSPVTCISYAHARSMSSIIPQAARHRWINKNCDFMVHYGTYEDSGDFRQVANGLKFNEKQNHTMLQIYASKCIKGEYFKNRGMDEKKTLNFIKNKIDKLTDWWMTPEEAIYYGFMDKII